VILRAVNIIEWCNVKICEFKTKNFGYSMCTAVDHYYMDQFSTNNQTIIKGKVLKLLDSTDTKKYGEEVKFTEVRHVNVSYDSENLLGYEVGLYDPRYLVTIGIAVQRRV